jgi:flagellar basal body-associated protein FliL
LKSKKEFDLISGSFFFIGTFPKSMSLYLYQIKNGGVKMKKRLLCLFIAIFLIMCVLAGCGSSSMTNSVSAQTAASAAKSKSLDIAFNEPVVGNGTDTTVSYSKSADTTVGSAESFTTDNGAVTQTSATTDTTLNSILEQRKIIRNANVTLEVDDFDTAYAQLKSIVEPFGYIQQSSIKKDKETVGLNEQLIKRGTIVIRVDMDRFDKILEGITGLGDVLDTNISTDDVTDKFYDVDSQLRLLKYEQSRLEEYLKKATDPDTIFKTESRLTDIRHQIENLTGTLNKLDSLVKLSTITINMSDKTTASEVSKTKGYWERLSSGFLNTLEGVGIFFGGVALFIISALPVILVLCIFVYIFLFFYKKKYKKKSKTVESSEENN